MRMANPEDQLLTVQEVANHLRVNKQTVRNWIDDGKLAAIRVGSRRVRIRRGDLDALLGKPTIEKPESGGERAGPGQALDRAVDGDDPDLSAALREVADAVQHLADALGGD